MTIYIIADNATDDIFIVTIGSKLYIKWKISIDAVLVIIGAIKNKKFFAVKLIIKINILK